MIYFVQYKRLNKKNYTSNPHARFPFCLCNPSYLTICIRSRKSIVDILDYQTHQILLLSEMTTDNLYLGNGQLVARTVGRGQLRADICALGQLVARTVAR